jgi:hypothetical protein
MKEYEHWAKEFKCDPECVEALHLGCLVINSYMAGFEKARHLAFEEMCEDISFDDNLGRILKLGEREI